MGTHWGGQYGALAAPLDKKYYGLVAQ